MVLLEVGYLDYWQGLERLEEERRGIEEKYGWEVLMLGLQWMGNDVQIPYFRRFPVVFMLDAVDGKKCGPISWSLSERGLGRGWGVRGEWAGGVI
jgi:hypothetical protein